ncbi:MAG: cytochrome P450 [Candidatus Binataceae bacterium]
MSSATDLSLSLCKSSKLPPGPGFFGTFNFVRNPFDFLDDCERRYGDWFTLRVPGVAPFVFTCDPHAIREIFQGDGAVFHAGKANRPLGAFMGERSLLFLDGAAHLHDRRLILPSFHGERMKSYAETMRSAADDEIAQWPIGSAFPIHFAMRTLTLNVISRTVFGLDDGPVAARMRELLTRLFDLYASRAGTLFALPALRINLGPWSPWGRAVRLHRALSLLLFEEFRRRREANDGTRDDVLSMLLEARDESGAPLDDETLRDEMLTLLLAGHETTAASLSWVINRMLTNPEVAERARNEVRSVVGEGPLHAEQVSKLRYLEAVINETMRLDPVIPNAGRELQAPVTIAGRELPAGVTVAPCIYLIHRHPALWPEPAKFNPDRFLEGHIDPYAFFPFGGGIRRCIGAAFASYQMKIVLAEILLRTELRAVEGYTARLERRSIAFAPSRGLPVILASRA